MAELAAWRRGFWRILPDMSGTGAVYSVTARAAVAHAQGASIMRTRPFVRAAALCVAVGLCVGVRGAKAQTSTDALEEPTNAALVYWRSWETVPPDAMEKVRDAYAADSTWKPDADVREALDQTGGLVTKAMKASAMPECDWGIEYSDGVGALLPHLGKLRGTARLVLADARRQMVDGKPDAAAARVAAVVRMGRQTRKDGTLISCLVGHAIVNSAAGELDVLAQGGLTPEGKRLVRGALAEFDRQDPFRIIPTLENERRMFLESIVTDLGDPAKRREMLALLAPDSDQESKAAAVMIAELSPEQLREDADLARAGYADMLAALSGQGPASRIGEVSAAAKSGKYGHIGRIVLPALDRMAERLEQGRALIARIERVVQE